MVASIRIERQRRRSLGMARAALLLLGLLVAGASVFGEEDEVGQRWPSPDGHYVIQHHLATDIRDREESVAEAVQLACYTLNTAKGVVLWSGVSWVDNSARSFHCVWASDSKSALILDHPDRGDVGACLVRPGKKDPALVLKISPLIAKIYAENGDGEDGRTLEKPWFGEWRYAKGSFEGVLVVAHKHMYRLHLKLDASSPMPALQLVDLKITEDWNEAWEKL